MPIQFIQKNVFIFCQLIINSMGHHFNDIEPHSDEGLFVCYSSSKFNPYCIIKTIQFAISFILLIWAIFEGILQLRHSPDSKYTYVYLVFIILALISNIVLCFWNNIYQLYSIETTFNNFYFLAIVSFILKQYLEKRMIFKKWRICYLLVIIINGFLFFLIFIDSIVTQSVPSITKNSSCEEIWYICVNVQCTSLSIGALIVLIRNHIQQYRKMKQFANTKVNNPLRLLWFWVGVNIVGQILNIVQSGLLLGSSPIKNCQIIQNNYEENQILMLFFVFTNMFFGYGVTIWYMGYQRRSSSIIQVFSSNLKFQYEDELRNDGKFELLVPSASITSKTN